MKNLIKKILREQWSPEAIQDLEAFHPDLFELDEQETTGDGSWKNPFDTPTPGNVPTQSYEPRTERKDNKHHIVPVPKIAFFKATELLTKMKDDTWFSENEDGGQATYYRGIDMETPLKVVGINRSGVEDKVFWAAFDNREGLRDGSITNYDQLYLRPFKRYEIPMYETARVYKTISYIPKIEAFSSEDAQNNVMYDEDGTFHSGEWYDEPGYEESDDDWETTEGPNPDGDIKQIGIVYDEQQGLNESLIKEMGPSPEENDIISELNDLVQSWDGCEEGMPVACRYKNQVQELIDKYKNLPL
jgi:hypothetical protein